MLVVVIWQLDKGPCEKCMGEGTLTEELTDGRIIIVECTVCRGAGEIE